ncbi:MAG: PBP1A family penicillin-binding protein, partial [Myxococcota bacterium]
ATVIYGRGGEIVARFAKERRTVVPFEQIPSVMVDAVVSAEDAGFFEHTGIDFMGIARCVIKNVTRGRAVCGASTITQQTVKTFFLTPEKSIIRKLKEMILAKRLEEALTKQDILFLYLNQIYFGHGAYGVEAASRVYFGKSVSKLEVQEAALLAGLPQSPSRLDPYRHSQRAMKRRAYVLARMHEQQKISDAQYEAAKESPLELDWRSSETNLDSNNHYAAHVRKILEALVGKDRLKSGGLKVYTGVDPQLQRTAEESLRRGLRALDKRQGWRGPLRHLERNDLKALLKLLDERRTTSGMKKRAKKNGAKPDEAAEGESAPTIWDLSRVRKAKTPEAVSAAARLPRFEVGETYGGPVVVVDDARKQAKVDLGGVQVVLPHRSGLGWARKFDIHTYTSRPSKPSDVLKVGDIVMVRATKLYKSKKESDPLEPTYEGRLEQTPKVEAAFVSIDPQTREVRALVGGYGLGAGTFNRAVQAKRQPGSTFKPFVYASAFATEKYTPLSICLDAPRTYRDPWTGQSWKPQNYGGKFSGEITLRKALTLSKNLCSVYLIDEVDVDPVLKMAKQAGISTALPRNLTLALGSGDVTPLEMVNAYATLAAGGQVAAPIFVRKVVGPDGDVLYETKAETKQTLRPEVVYLITSLMQSVVEDGTAKRVKQLERPVAGKTGTTNESRNAWFIGFTPDHVAGVWVGFDNNDPLGPYETGGRAAIPVWLDYMTEAMRDKPPQEFVPPANVVFALVDPKTGNLAPPDFEGALNEPFIKGTEPTEFVPNGLPPEQLEFHDEEFR